MTVSVDGGCYFCWQSICKKEQTTPPVHFFAQVKLQHIFTIRHAEEASDVGIQGMRHVLLAKRDTLKTIVWILTA